MGHSGNCLNNCFCAFNIPEKAIYSKHLLSPLNCLVMTSSLKWNTGLGASTGDLGSNFSFATNLVVISAFTSKNLSFPTWKMRLDQSFSDLLCHSFSVSSRKQGTEATCLETTQRELFPWPVLPAYQPQVWVPSYPLCPGQNTPAGWLPEKHFEKPSREQTGTKELTTAVATKTLKLQHVSPGLSEDTVLAQPPELSPPRSQTLHLLSPRVLIYSCNPHPLNILKMSSPSHETLIWCYTHLEWPFYLSTPQRAQQQLTISFLGNTTWYRV